MSSQDYLCPSYKEPKAYLRREGTKSIFDKEKKKRKEERPKRKYWQKDKEVGAGNTLSMESIEETS